MHESSQVRWLVARHAGPYPRGRQDRARRGAPGAADRRGLGISGDYESADRLRAARGARRAGATNRSGRRSPGVTARRSTIWSDLAADAAPASRPTRCSRSSTTPLHGIQLLGHCPPRALDVVASFGERLSALIVAAYVHRFRPARFVDAREFVITDDQFTHANVIFSRTNRAARRVLRAAAARPAAGHSDRDRVHRLHRRRPDDDHRPERIGLHAAPSSARRWVRRSSRSGPTSTAC